MRKPLAVVFDMDGLLFDTERLADLSWRMLRDEYNMGDMEQLLHDCVGLNRPSLLALLHRYYGPDFPAVEFLDRSRQLLYRMTEENLPIKPGAKELLEYLQQENIPVAMATSSRHGIAEERLERTGLARYFRAVVGGDMVEHGKPHPEPYLTACSLLGADPATALGLEDSPNGVRSIHAAGMTAIMVPDLIAPTEELTALCAAVCPSLLEVRDLLKAL